MLIIQLIALIIICGVAVFFDVKKSRIPNELTIPAALAGLLLPSYFGHLDGFILAFMGLVFVFFVGGALWVLGLWGAGDHKLFLAVGSFLGIPAVGFALLAIAVCGGVQSAVQMYRNKTSMAYSISILSGVLVYALYIYFPVIF